jgi:hypothetical protein
LSNVPPPVPLGSQNWNEVLLTTFSSATSTNAGPDPPVSVNVPQMPTP